jgi:hypothetical protein
MSVLSVVLGRGARLFYLHLREERKYQNQPLLLIPFGLQRCHELK